MRNPLTRSGRTLANHRPGSIGRDRLSQEAHHPYLVLVARRPDVVGGHRERHPIRLTDGTFVRATGFTLVEGDTVAVPVETPWETIVANGGILEMSLTWTR